MQFGYIVVKGIVLVMACAQLRVRNTYIREKVRVKAVINEITVLPDQRIPVGVIHKFNFVVVGAISIAEKLKASIVTGMRRGNYFGIKRGAPIMIFPVTNRMKRGVT